jgi:hypothetical protein
MSYRVFVCGFNGFKQIEKSDRFKIPGFIQMADKVDDVILSKTSLALRISKYSYFILTPYESFDFTITVLN